MSSDPPPQSVSVRNMISMFEKQIIPVQNNETSSLKRTKSMGHIWSSQRQSAPKAEGSLEDRMNDLRNHLQRYREYSKEHHSELQDKIFMLLTDIINAEPQQDADSRRSLIEDVKQLNKTLILRLPADSKSMKQPPQKLPKNIIFTQQTSIVQSPDPDKDSENQEVAAPQNTTEPDSCNVLSEMVPSVKKLKSLFEKVGEKCGIGLNNISSANKSPKRLLSFSDTSCDIRYVPYHEHVKQSDTGEKYVVEDANLGKDRVVHNPSLHRNNSMKITELRALFEGQKNGGIVQSGSLKQGKPDNEIDEDYLSVDSEVEEEFDKLVNENGNYNSFQSETNRNSGYSEPSTSPVSPPVIENGNGFYSIPSSIHVESTLENEE